MTSEGENAEKEEKISVYDTMGALENLTTSFLLVFDNAESRESIRKNFPNSSYKRILVTSRNPDWRTSGIKLSVFSEEDSIKYLQKVIDQEESLTDIKIVAKVIGGSPLVLKQAVAWVD